MNLQALKSPVAGCPVLAKRRRTWGIVVRKRRMAILGGGADLGVWFFGRMTQPKAEQCLVGDARR